MKTTLALVLMASAALAQTWSELDGSATGGGVSRTGDVAMDRPAVAIDSHGYPVVAWRDWSARGEIFVKRWDGAAWLEYVDSVTALGSATRGIAEPFGDYRDHAYGTCLVLDSMDRPIVAWYTEPYVWEIFLKRWDGATWVELGGSGSGTAGNGGISRMAGVSKTPTLALDAHDNPVVAWSEKNSGTGVASQIYVKRWTGDLWVEMGGSASAGGISSDPGNNAFAPSIGVDGAGRIAVAWCSYGDDSIRVKRWDGNAWEDLGYGINGDIGSRGSMPRLAVDGSDRVIVAWSGQNPAGTPGTGYQVYVKRFDAAWEEMGNSASGDGISATLTSSDSATLAADESGRVTVAWMTHADTGDALDIQLKLWNGSDWNEIEGSATGAGVSGSPTTGSSYPAVAMSRAGQIAVAWLEGVGDIMLRATAAPLPTLGQCRPDGSELPAGEWIIGGDGFIAKMNFLHPTGRDFQLEVEVAETGAAFAGGLQRSAPFATGTTAALRVTGLAPDKNYRWRARAVNVALNQAFDWMAFGGNPDLASRTDFRLRGNEAPVVESIGQFHAGRPLPVGGANAIDGMLTFSASMADGHGDAARFEIEMVAVDRAFEGVATWSSELAAPGATVSITALIPSGRSKWQYRAVDAHGMAAAWAAYGGNGDDADVAAFAFGSTSAGSCAASAGARGYFLVLGMILIVAKRK